MPYNKMIKGRTPGVQIHITLPDDVPDSEKLQIVRELQMFADRFDSVELFDEVMADAMTDFGFVCEDETIH